MNRGNKSQRHDKPSIKYRCGPLDGASFELADFDFKDYVSTYENNKVESRTPELRSSEILSTRELISAIGFIWDHATRPLSVLLPKSSCRYDNGHVRKQNVLGYSTEKWRCSETAGDRQNNLVNLTSISNLPLLGHANLKYLKVVNKISFTEPSAYASSLLRRFLQGHPKMPHACLEDKDISSIGIPYDLEKIYRWMSDIAFENPGHQMNFSAIEKQKDGDSNGCNISAPPSCPVPTEKSKNAGNSMTGNAGCNTENTKLAVSSAGHNEIHATNMSVSDTSFLCEHASAKDIDASTYQVPGSKLCVGSVVSNLPSCSSDIEGSRTSIKPDVEEKGNEQKELVVEDNSEVGSFLPVKEKPHYMLAKQEHAFAGAMAGIFVSMCLHPVDTIKTVVQSCRANSKSLFDISRSIISERGVTGLYHGISTNIASSAPISAVYTFTYESVKGTLIPFFPKEYESLAHCMAGGCASIATSFIFTPSECIKQQMQVGSRYQNCWNALLGIIEKGGLTSLYAGWGAVLCRNIPHSIIKFYTYESLKQLLSPVQLNGQTNTFVTLVSGGLAGSTAALFTTPFDVVKTRLQTQNPGYINQYHGVLDTLKEIARSDGLKGLYRGLTPRLFMCMTQGALFFASYESFKTLLSLKASEVKVQAVPHNNHREYHSLCYLDLEEESLMYMLIN